MFPVRHKIVVLIDDTDLDKWVNETFPGRRFTFTSLHGEANNSSTYSYIVDLNGYDFSTLDAKMDEWLASTPGEYDDVPKMSPEEFFHVLAKRGFWPVGKFSIYVWW